MELKDKIIFGIGYSFVLFALLFGCEPEAVKPVPLPSVETKPILGKKLRLWSTYYFSPWLKSGNGPFVLRDKTGMSISPKIRHDQKCYIQMQGSGKIDNAFYTYVTTNGNGLSQADYCGTYGGAYKGESHKVKFAKNTRTTYGEGSFDNELIPFVSIACPKQYPNNTKFYIPDAKGTKLPDGKVHDGIFICHDRGRAITGNHIDTFIGLVDQRSSWKMNDWNRISKSNPFKHVKSKGHYFDAYLVK